MPKLTRRSVTAALAATALTLGLGAAWAIDYPAPKPLADGSQAEMSTIKKTDKVRIAYMPPATEFNYYMAIGEGIKAAAGDAGVETFMLAPQSGADINGQMGMIQDVITQNVSAIILSTHDEAAAALKRLSGDDELTVISVDRFGHVADEVPPGSKAG